MKRLLFLAFLVCWPSMALSEARLIASFAAPHTNGQLYDSPCTNGKVLKVIPEPLWERTKHATGTYQGQEFGVCWLWNMNESAAIVVWDDGGHFAVPRRALKFPVDV